MASAQSKRGGGGRDMVLESRHLLGIFLGVVVICGVFFTLGFVLGRTQYDASVRAAAGPARPAAAPSAPAGAAKSPAAGPQTGTIPRPAEWDFPKVAEPRPAAEEERLQPREPAPAAPPARPAVAARLKAPNVPRGALVLQVAALSREADALALADALQKKQYPAYVLVPTTDALYRVQVGPYGDAESAEAVKRALEREGFKAIVRR